MIKKLPVILDVDPGIDDAAMITVALNNPGFDVKLVTTVSGNVDIENTTNNAAKLLSFYNRYDIPLAKGAKAPLEKTPVFAENIHGATGMDGYDFGNAPFVVLPDVLEAMEQTILEADEPITIIATGALTNIANLISEKPELLDLIKEIVIMGGSLSNGNITPFAEFNIFVDPKAAEIVFMSPIKKRILGLDVTLKTLIDPEKLPTNKVGSMLKSLFDNYHDNQTGGKPMHDVNTLYALLFPDSYKWANRNLAVEVGSQYDGRTKLTTDSTNTQVAYDIEEPAAFSRWFIKEIESYDL
jgi:non-specific riboncleoside hydrolase